MHLKRGPFSAKDVERVLQADGWTEQPGGNHPVWRHPTLAGEIHRLEEVDGLRISDPILKGMVRTCGIPKDRLLKLLNGIDD